MNETMNGPPGDYDALYRDAEYTALFLSFTEGCIAPDEFVRAVTPIMARFDIAV